MVKMTLNLDSKSDILFLYRPISIRVNKPLKQIEKKFLMQFWQRIEFSWTIK